MESLTEDRMIRPSSTKVREGDELFIFLELGVPFALHPIGQQYKLICVILAQGLVAGEAFKVIQKSG